MASHSAAQDLVRNNDFYRDPKRYNFEDVTFSLLIVGPSGAGKSAFCNFLLKEKIFTEAPGILPGTEKADYCTIPCGDDGDMLIVDCPGFCDPKRSHEEILIEISKAALLCRNGMDAIGIVIDPTSRFAETQKISYEQMELFGGKFWNHAFIIFNHEKTIQDKMGFKDASEYIYTMLGNPNCPETFRQLLAKVENRFISVESSQIDDDHYRCNIIGFLMQEILLVKSMNDNSYFNCFSHRARISFFSFSSSWEQLESLKNEQSLYKKKLGEFARLVISHEREIGKLNEQMNVGHKCTIL